MPRRTALIVPVPEADAHFDGPPGVTAHVTVLFPFLDDDGVDEAALEELLAPVEPFAFELRALERFPDGLRWLRPEPSAPFAELTRAVWRRWPSHPPYEGAHDEVIPHVTVMRDDVALPIACRATEVRLLVEEADGSFTTRRSFPLRQGVA